MSEVTEALEVETAENIEVDLTPEEIRADVKRRLQSQEMGLPHWPHNSAMAAVDPLLHGKRKDVEHWLESLDREAANIQANDQLSDKGKADALERVRQDVLQEIERRSNIDESLRALARLKNQIQQKTEAARNAPGWLARQQQVIQWVTSLTPQERQKAWTEALKGNDAEFREAIALTSPTIRRVIAPQLSDNKVSEIMQQFSERHAPEESRELAGLQVEIDIMKKTITAALNRAHVKRLPGKGLN